MPVNSIGSLASVAFDGDFVCGNGPKHGFPPKPKQVVSSELLGSILSANRGTATLFDDDRCGTLPPIPPMPHFPVELGTAQVIRY